MKNLLKIITSSILLGLIVWKLGGLRNVVSLMVRADFTYVILAFLFFTFDRVLMTYKWVRLLRGRSVHLQLTRGIMIYCASMVWGMFLPATVGADAIRAFSTTRTGLDSNEVIASIIIERMVGFLSALLLGLLSIILLSRLGVLDSRFHIVWWAGGASLAIAIVLFLTSFSQAVFDLLHGRMFQRISDTKVMRRMRQFHMVYRTYQENKKDLAEFFVFTFIEQLIPILVSWLIARALHIEVGLLFIAGAIPMTQLIARIPISIDGLGLYEGVFILLISLAGVSAAEAVAIAFAGRIIQTASFLPWWMAYVIGTGDVKPPGKLAEER